MPRALATLLLLAPTACRIDHVVAVLTEGTGSSSAATSDPTTGGACGLPPSAPCEGVNDPFTAIGLGCPETPISGQTVDAGEPASYRVTTQFGNAYWAAREGGQALVLTTGALPIPQVNGNLFVTAGSAQPGTDNAADNAVDLPPPIEPFPGSATGTPYQQCDGENDCSDSLPDLWENGTASDLVALRFSAQVPAGAAGFALDLAWLSAEFPERADTPDGDLFVAWLSSEAFTGNLATLEGAALTAMATRGRVVEAGLVGDHPGVQATGFEGVEGPPCDYGWAVYSSCPRGGATGWMTMRGPVAAGETIALTLALMDRGDALGDTAVMLDAWRWTCDACTFGADCGLQ